MNNSLVVEDNLLILSDNLIQDLQTVPGDRLSIEYSEYNDIIVPIIIKSDGGNKLTKKNTISFKGKANSELSEFGTKFSHINENGVIYLFGEDPKYRVFTDVKTAVKHIDKSIIEDNDYDIKINSFIL